MLVVSRIVGTRKASPEGVHRAALITHAVTRLIGETARVYRVFNAQCQLRG